MIAPFLESKYEHMNMWNHNKWNKQLVAVRSTCRGSTTAMFILSFACLLVLVVACFLILKEQEKDRHHHCALVVAAATTLLVSSLARRRDPWLVCFLKSVAQSMLSYRTKISWDYQISDLLTNDYYLISCYAPVVSILHRQQ